MHTQRKRLLIAAHGTASAAGMDTLYGFARAVADARPDHDVDVDLCFLDVADPDLATALDERPTVVVPALLSTGFHVQSDIPAAVAGFPRTRIARHLGPHPLLATALAERLDELDEPPPPGATTVLAASGSSRSGAAAEVSQAADLLAGRLHRPVRTLTLGAGLADRLDEIGTAVRVATYLLAEGSFLDNLRRGIAAHPAGGTLAAPLGAHPSVVELVWLRYDSAAEAGMPTR